MAVRTFTAVIYKEDELYVAEYPEVGTASQGDTIEVGPARGERVGHSGQT